MEGHIATAYDSERRKLLAFQVAEYMTAELANRPIKQLFGQQHRFKMVHSDMGSQYTMICLKSL